MSPLPLEGIKVLDWTRLLPGPFATLVLGDLGAQVDKLEDPQGGDICATCHRRSTAPRRSSSR